MELDLELELEFCGFNPGEHTKKLISVISFWFSSPSGSFGLLDNPGVIRIDNVDYGDLISDPDQENENLKGRS